MQFFPENISAFEVIEKCATIVIACFTLVFSYYIFRYQSKKDDNDLKLDWYKLIVIESKFIEFFNFFDNISEILHSVKITDNLTMDLRMDINDKVLDELTTIELNFISLLMAVDTMLYQCVKYQFDELVDGITIKLSNETLTLNDNEIFDNEISSHISNYKTITLKMFVDFKGRNDTHK